MARPGHAHRSGPLDHPSLLLSATAALLALSWVAFAGSLHAHEMLVGAVVIALSTAFCALVFRSNTLSFALRWPDIIQCWRIPWYILSGCAEITWLLCRDFAGKPAKSLYRVCGFRGGLRDPVAVERTALAIAFTTTAPNFIVIGIDPHQNHMLFHQIQRSDVPKMTKALGADA